MNDNPEEIVVNTSEDHSHEDQTNKNNIVDESPQKSVIQKEIYHAEDNSALQHKGSADINESQDTQHFKREDKPLSKTSDSMLLNQQSDTYQTQPYNRVDKFLNKTSDSNQIADSYQSLHRSGTQKIDSTGNITCKKHGKIEIGIDTKTFKLVCKRCMEEGSVEENIFNNCKEENHSEELNINDFTIDEDMCESHSSEKVIYYCDDCKEPLCRNCISTHKGHNTMLPVNLKEDLLRIFKDDISKLQKIQPKIEESLKSIGEINNQIRGLNSKMRSQISNSSVNLDRILKERLKGNALEFQTMFNGVDSDVEEAYKRLSLVQKKCVRLLKEIAEIENTMKTQKSSVKICAYIKKVSNDTVEAKKVIAESHGFLGTKIKQLKKRGEEELKRFKKEIELSLKKENIYEKSIANSVLTGATSQGIRLRRFFKYTIEDLVYFRTSSVFMSVNKSICLSGLGICGLLISKKVERSLKLHITISEIEDGIITNKLLEDNQNLKSIVNEYDPIISFYFSKVIVLNPGVTYVISCTNLDSTNHYVEIWRGKVYLPSNSKDLIQDIKCNNSGIEFRFLPSKGVESDFNEFGIGLISDLLYSYTN